MLCLFYAPSSCPSNNETPEAQYLVEHLRGDAPDGWCSDTKHARPLFGTPWDLAYAGGDIPLCHATEAARRPDDRQRPLLHACTSDMLVLIRWQRRKLTVADYGKSFRRIVQPLSLVMATKVSIWFQNGSGSVTIVRGHRPSCGDLALDCSFWEWRVLKGARYVWRIGSR
ncbi:MAG: hypothetical protein ACRD7E_19305 [Bryobacteraceae bacterium]